MKKRSARRDFIYWDGEMVQMELIDMARVPGRYFS
jgi:hypothetical protein